MTTPTSNQAISPSKGYSPVNVPDSPLSSQPGQLTGIPRRVRDSAADLYNAIQEWNKYQIDGMELINQIKNKKLSELEKEKNKIQMYPSGLEELCFQLEEVCKKMASTVLKLKTILKHFEAIKQLQERKNNSRPIFITWTEDKYVDVTKTICEGYDKEVLLKKYVQEHIAHVFHKEEIMLHCALWAHQPYINKDSNFLLESLLKETGHR